MKLVTRNADYAIRAVSYIAKSDNRIVPASELVRELRIPRPFLRKILQSLTRDGLIASYRGIGGGFRIARPAGRMSLVDIIEVFQGPLKISECLFKKSICPDVKTCPLKKRLNRIEDFVLYELNSITIEELIKKRG